MSRREGDLSQFLKPAAVRRAAERADAPNEVVLDASRRERIGFDEAILCEWKSVDQIATILERAAGACMPLLLTRLSPDKFAALPDERRRRIDFDPVSRTGFFLARPAARPRQTVAIVSAGTSDVPAAREAARSLAYFGVSASEITDVGVAGIWRLMERLDEIRDAPVVIVAAGMDGALPSVVGGLVGGVVIALPTSVGYGASEGGRTALNACLASCAPGLLVVNIDNGYGAACAALRIMNLAAGKTSRAAQED